MRAHWADYRSSRDLPAGQNWIAIRLAVDLATRFAQRAGSDIVDLQLEAVRHNACWKFHRDCVRLRLVTTYFGPATQIVTAPNAARALRLQRNYNGPYLPIPVQTVALFKSDGAEHGIGVVHRSPPTESMGQYRLVLTVNLPSPASPETWEKLTRNKQ